MYNLIIIVAVFILGLVFGVVGSKDIAKDEIKAAYYDGMVSCMNAQELGKAVIENEYREDTL